MLKRNQNFRYIQKTSNYLPCWDIPFHSHSDFVEQGAVWTSSSFAAPTEAGKSYQTNVTLPTITVNGSEKRDAKSTGVCTQEIFVSRTSILLWPLGQWLTSVVVQLLGLMKPELGIILSHISIGIPSNRLSLDNRAGQICSKTEYAFWVSSGS